MLIIVFINKFCCCLLYMHVDLNNVKVRRCWPRSCWMPICGPFFPCSCCTHYRSFSWVSGMIASVIIFAEAHADGALAFGIKDQLTLTRDHIKILDSIVV
uniref:Uncharacterized protein n=1 Tax=Aegilops tauschii subsp. strangulata TaxID=200361 RepID=A0A453NU13_AEGTS